MRDRASDRVSLHRYDSLTGVPSVQRALAFEKGSVLFNIGALYTQIGARQDRSTLTGIQNAIDAFQRAAGTESSGSVCFSGSFTVCYSYIHVLIIKKNSDSITININNKTFHALSNMFRLNTRILTTNIISPHLIIYIYVHYSKNIVSKTFFKIF